MAKDTPEWLKNAVIYSVFTRNYSKNGTFNEVYEDLERIHSLGTDIVWFMPIHPIGKVNRKTAQGSPYAISDYRAVNPDLGTEADFKKVIEKIHSLGMKVIIDVVYNHTSPDAVLLKEHPDFYLRDDQGNLKRKFDDWWDIIDLDYNNKQLWDYQIETLQKWLDFGVDGFRCDVAPMVPIEFWIEARRRLNEKREVIWLTESVHKSFVKALRDLNYNANSDPELHQAFDLSYDYDGYEYLQEYWRGRAELRDYLNHLYIQETLYPAHAIKMRFIENHDVQRIHAIVKNYESLQNWTAFYTLLPGAMLVYNGQEIPSQRWPDFDIFSSAAIKSYVEKEFPSKRTKPSDRDVIDWEDTKPGFADYLTKVLKFAKEIKGKCNRFTVEEVRKGLIKIVWKNEKEEYLALLNLEERYGDTTLNFECEGVDLLSGNPREIKTQYVIEKLPVLIKVKK